MHVHRSNRLERLAARLATSLERPPADPIAQEHLVVQSRGMAQWLALELARLQGVAANLRVWQPRALVEHVLAAALGDEAEPARAWSRERIQWTLLRLLPAHLDDPTLAPLRSWLAAGGGDADVARRWQLAGRIAHTFDQLPVFRPDWVNAWSAGDDVGPLDAATAWQPVLWRALEAELGAHHVAARHARLVGVDRPARPHELPERLAVFGVTTLPPLHLDVLQRLGAWTEVRLFQLSPSREYWAHVRSARERARLSGRNGLGDDVDDDALHLEEGHPLLASLGRVGRDHQAVLEDLEYAEDDEDLYDEPAGEGALPVLQRDVLALRARRADERVPITPGDPTLQVIGCHSPAREVEVLRDALWERLRADPTLRPRDLVVLVPDVATYGPLVEAVFGVPPDDALHLPFTIADRPVAAGSEVARALLELFGLVGSRLPAPAVVDLLAHGPIRRRFGLGEADVVAIEQLVAESGVRWGRDRAHRAALGQPDVESHTWRFGLDRLLLGHAVAVARPVHGVVPWVDAEGEGALLVGRLADFVHGLLAVLDDLSVPRAPAAWLDRLDALLLDWFAPGQAGAGEAAADEVDRLREGVASLRAEVVAVGVDEPVPLAVVRDLVESRLLGERREGAFLRQGVTFCEMLPMRAIPARVVALLGMSDESFPRADARVGFDLLERERRRGDRSKRDDDRYLVLEAVLSARDALIVTYVSRSVQDNEPRPPSVVLADLLDAVDASFVGPGAAPARDALVVHHPLQPFSVRYVTAPADGQPTPRTFDPVADAGARALVEARAPLPPFLSGPVPPSPPVAEVDLATLERFLADPVVGFWERRLGIGRLDEVEPLADREPLEVEGLAEHQLGERLLELRREGLSWDACRVVLAGEGRLPLGHLANPLLARLARRVDGILAPAAGRLAEPALPPASLDVVLDGVRVFGRVGDLRASGHVRVGYALGRSGRHRLALWVRHLALQIAVDGGPRGSESYGREGDKGGRMLGFGPIDVAEARAALGALARTWVEGQAAPLPFLPDAGWAWIEAVSTGSGGDDALRRARQKAADYWRSRTRSAEVWARLLGGEDGFDRPLDRASEPGPFERVAERVLRPLHRVGGGA